MRTGGLDRRTAAWAGYDVASSVYFGAAPAVLLPLYFRELMAGFANPTAAWGLLAAAAILSSGMAALAAAALSARFSRFSLLKTATLGLVVAIVGLSWNPWSSLLLAAVCFFAAQSFYFAATTVYESFLPDLLPQSARQRLSGFGWAIGYAGGLFAILVLIRLVAGQGESLPLLQRCFTVLAVISAVFFAVALTLMQRAGFAALGEARGAARFTGVLHSLRPWRQNSPVFLLLAGTMLVQMGVSVVITFTAPILASNFGETLPDLLWLLALVHVISVPATLGWNVLLSGPLRLPAMAVLLASWGAVLLMMAFGSGAWTPLVTVGVIGCCVGATSAAVRGFLAEIVPPHASASAYFALATVVGRAAAALGPAIFALVTTLAGEAAALLCILAITGAGSALVILHVLRAPHPARTAAVESQISA